MDRVARASSVGLDGWKYLGADGIERRLLDGLTARLARLAQERDAHLADLIGDRITAAFVGE